MPTPRVTTVVVTYQSARTLPACVGAIQRGQQAGLLHGVFVDNGSTDGTLPYLQTHAASWAQVLATGVNNGFGRGCNIGLQEVDTEYTLFINPDAVVEPPAIQALLAFMDQHSEAGIAGPAMLEGDDPAHPVLQETGPRPTPMSAFQSRLPWWRGASGMRPIQPGAAPFRTGWVCGAVLMVRTALMRRLGGFDPRFFLYWEETDLCARADQSGLQTWAVGEAVTHHVGGASSTVDDTKIAGCIAQHYYQSRYYYMTKHHGSWRAAAGEVLEYALLCLLTAADWARGRGSVRIKPRLQARLFSQPQRG